MQKPLKDLENEIDEAESENSDSGFMESDNEIGDVDDEVGVVNISLEELGVQVNSVTTEKDDEHESDSSKSLHTLHDSDSDGQHWPEFNVDIDLTDPKLMKGLVFASKKHLTEAVLEYSRRNRYEVKFLNNDKRRVNVVCRAGCPWRLWGSPMSSNKQTWQIKTYEAEHRCLRVIKNRNLTAKSIAKKYLHKFIADPKYSSTLLKQDVDMEYMTDVSLTKCTRAREWALQTVFGNWRDQYEKIYEYLAELRHTNPGITTICYLDLRLFQRMYVCLEACKLGYKSGCRSIISVDGCHLKGYYGGHILTAVGIDANDCIYPIAYAVVESEYEGSWCWFLELLQNDLEITNSHHISFMSDRQKGLMEAIAEKFPNGEHRTCVRHLCWPKHVGCNKFQVQHGPANQHTVELDSTTCSCRKWDLTGVPCCHAVSCILMIHGRPEDYVNECYTKRKQLEIYRHFISPIKGPNQGSPVLDMEPILPPQLRRPPGRPHKVRRKEADEPLVSGKIGRKGETKGCRKCG
ncbi:hypothetical protein V6N13_124052 [Hibiscus sabdariffa]